MEGFIPDGAEGKQEDGGVEEGYQDGGFLETIGVFIGCADAKKADGDQRHGEACYVREVMAGVGQKGQGVDVKSDDDFDDDEEEVEDNADDESAVDLFEINGMVMVAKAVG